MESHVVRFICGLTASFDLSANEFILVESSERLQRNGKQLGFGDRLKEAEC